MTRFFIFFMITAGACGCTSSVDLKVDVRGSGFKDANLSNLKVTCGSPDSTRTYTAPINITNDTYGHIKMHAVVSVPKGRTIYCSLAGEGVSNLPYIPVYHNSFSSRYFSVIKDTTLKVQLRRTALVMNHETYEHVTFKKIDHISNKDIQIANVKQRDISNW